MVISVTVTIIAIRIMTIIIIKRAKTALDVKNSYKNFTNIKVIITTSLIKATSDMEAMTNIKTKTKTRTTIDTRPQ